MAPGTNVVIIEAASDLVHWQSVFTNAPILGTVQFLDTSGPGLTRRFYRAELLPQRRVWQGCRNGQMDRPEEACVNRFNTTVPNAPQRFNRVVAPGFASPMRKVYFRLPE